MAPHESYLDNPSFLSDSTDRLPTRLQEEYMRRALNRKGPATFQKLVTFVQRDAVAMEIDPKFWKESTPKKRTEDNRIITAARTRNFLHVYQSWKKIANR